MKSGPMNFFGFAETVLGTSISGFIATQLQIDKMSVDEIKTKLAEMRSEVHHDEGLTLQLTQALVNKGGMAIYIYMILMI